MNDILAVILKDTYSLTQFKHRVRLLKSTLIKQFFGGETPDQTPPGTDLTWLKSLPSDLYQKFNKDNVYDIFSELEKMSAKFPVLTMYLTFEPDDATLFNLGTFVRKTFSPALLLDIKFDPNLIAGTALVWKGVYRDYSLRAKIENMKSEITEGFKKFLR